MHAQQRLNIGATPVHALGRDRASIVGDFENLSLSIPAKQNMASSAIKGVLQQLEDNPSRIILHHRFFRAQVPQPSTFRQVPMFFEMRVQQGPHLCKVAG